ncbi:hypothetical protein [Geotalea uraniireducens]|uniref:hypothetical protein n=1 Tax=Geotalea uraniireducens TaxID=351604 RepID=UPI00059CC11D|nr:hypothetical protein [Geotalea uraniireducens]
MRLNKGGCRIVEPSQQVGAEVFLDLPRQVLSQVKVPDIAEGEVEEFSRGLAVAVKERFESFT